MLAPVYLNILFSTFFFSAYTLIILSLWIPCTSISFYLCKHCSSSSRTLLLGLMMLASHVSRAILSWRYYFLSFLPHHVAFLSQIQLQASWWKAFLLNYYFFKWYADLSCLFITLLHWFKECSTFWDLLYSISVTNFCRHPTGTWEECLFSNKWMQGCIPSESNLVILLFKYLVFTNFLKSALSLTKRRMLKFHSNIVMYQFILIKVFVFALYRYIFGNYATGYIKI